MSFPVDEAHMLKAEQVLGRRLPAALRSRLLQNNGGDVQTVDQDWVLYPVFDPTDRKRAIRSANHILRETDRWRACYGFPAEAIAIAEDGSGNALIVCASSDEVERWDHETGERETVNIDWD